MKSFLSAELLDSFVARTVETTPDSASSSVASCESLGRDWQRLGVRPGDVILLCLPNGKQLLNHFFGVLMAGGVPALVLPNMPAARLRDISQSMGARAVGALRRPSSELGANEFTAVGGLQVGMFPCSAEPSAAPGEVVVLTSGTSGFSSGCVFDIESLLLNARRHSEAIGQRKEDVVLVNLPLYFSFALVAQALASLVLGNRLLISGPPFNAAIYQKTLRDCGVTVSSLTPVLVRSMLKTDAKFLNRLRVLTVGGDALEPETVARLVEIRQGGEFYLTYGLTQAGPRVSTLAAHAEPPRRYRSAGRPMPGTSVFLRPVGGASDLNQLYVTSETVMKRAIGRVEGRPDQHTLSRTIATGDAFDQDEDGYLYFKGRLCDYISRNGEKISLAAVRRIVSQLPHVVSVRTTIVEHQDGGEEFDLEVCLGDGAERPQDPREMLRGLLRRTEMPRSIRIDATKEMSANRYK
jgi:acyl-CoA synthetase (AMP-forming)/AMP-acid ligase II